MAETKEDAKKVDFEARDYQVQLAEMAFESNKIIFLPTGSGKTFLSTIVMNHFLKKNCGKKFEEGGKRAFFLVNTVALVQQQVKQIRCRTPWVVNGYSGDMGVDFWCKETWHEELKKTEILVMTAQIFLNLILESILSLKQVAVMVFDECHHAVVDHPMRQIMQQFKNVPTSLQPRVLGLTATLLNKNLPVKKVDVEIKTLETTFLSQIATADDESIVKVYSTNPMERRVWYDENNINGIVYSQRNSLFENLINSIEQLQIDDEEKADKSIKPHGTYQIDDRSKKTNKELKNVLSDIQINMDELGLYGGDISILARLIQIQKMIFNCPSEVSKTVFSFVTTELVFLRKYFAIKMGNKSELEKIKENSSDKLKKLFAILKKMKQNDTAIVFVKRRFTAKIMHTIVSNAAKVDPKLSHVKCDFIVGYNVTNPFKDTRENLLQRNYNDRVLEKFNGGLLNVLFGSNVVEEGMDISKCNIVIMFDAPMDFRSYTQSKGRARHADSSYIIMTSDPIYQAKYSGFKEVEDKLRQLLCDGVYKEREEPSLEEADATLFANIPGLEPYRPRGSDGPVITALSAITYINRYFLSLKADKFTRVTPFWFMETKGNNSTEFKCYLQLPMESKVGGLIEGTWQKSKENAKRSVAMEACKILHKNGELDDEHLLPISIEAQAINSISLLPHWNSEEKFDIGTKRSKRLWQKKWPECLTGCMPLANTPVYLHVLQLEVLALPPPDNHRLLVFHEVLTSPVSFAIVSTKNLPKIAPFPLYLSTGEVEVKVAEGKLHSLNEIELKKLSTFHGIMFDKVMGVVKPFLIRDYSNNQNSYLIAPVVIGTNSLEIDWDVVEKANQPFPNPEEKPTEEQRQNVVVNDENYNQMIVTPWYRPEAAQKYIVTKVCYDMNEDSAFPSDNYPTYKKYFFEKYNITPMKNQPLIEVRAISSRMNNLKPLSLTKALRRTNKDENEEFEVWLVPEFCHVFPVPGRYWLKARLLPSILHRVTQLCAAEELRQWLVRDTGIGLLQQGDKLKKLEADASLAKNIPVEVTQLLTPLTIQMRTQGSVGRSNQTVWELEEEPLDIDRDMEVTLFDVKYYGEFANQPLCTTTKKNIFTEDTKKPIAQFVSPPSLKMLKRTIKEGPEQVHVLQAITVAIANDFTNCERLETLGDSFLKFAVSLVLFETQKDVSEGVLTNLKGQIVGNKNLFFCGKNKNLANVLEVRDLMPREEWIPPQYYVEHSIRGTIITAGLDPSCLYRMDIPAEDVVAGRISKATREEISDILFSADERVNAQTCTFTNELALTDKNVADAVEAILGLYLENSGLQGAMRVMNWFGVMDPEVARPSVLTATGLTSPTKGDRGSPADHLLQPELLEDILHYRFNDRAYMLQALTHPTYSRNNITQCYQRLEFLGDSILDFLITVHIFERCKQLHPGDLTDLRSALVNNITLGCLSVRHGLHRFLLHRSSALNEVIARFVKHQDERHHIIDNDILFLCEENEVNISESIEVPKALGDVIEALIGAIYLDSGKNLDITWKVVFNLFKEEIEKFSTDVPKNHVRMLYESKCNPIFGSSLDDKGVVMVSVEVMHEGKVITCHGFGDNKHKAKRAAAKQALRLIRGSLVR